MMLRIGNNKNTRRTLTGTGKTQDARWRDKKSRFKKGFTLVEVMVAVVVLSLGVVVTFEAFMVSLDAFSLYYNYCKAQHIINEKMWEAQASFNEPVKITAPMLGSGIIKAGAKDFQWQQALSVLDVDQALYKIDISVSWQEELKTRRLAHSGLIKKGFNNIFPVFEE